MPVTETPRDAANAPRSRATAPPSPQATALSPSAIGQWRARPAAVTPACAREAPASTPRPSGNTASICTGAMTQVAHDPTTAVQQTRVPGGIATPGPPATTVPAPSTPTSNGNSKRIEYVPDRTRLST